ncbi:MAG: ATP phosphoribosyltransferase [Acholeplasmataceae bacterium]
MKKGLDVALPKGRLATEALDLMRRSGYAMDSIRDDRQLIVTDPNDGFRFMFVKPSDVITYVTRGVADVGIVGMDMVLEAKEDLFELLHLNIGKCRLVVAGLDPKSYEKATEITVATKYPRIARDYFATRNKSVTIVKLNGSVELGPLVGLSDAILDLYETGQTLRVNGLSVFEKVREIESMLIANRASYRLKYEAIRALRQRLAKGVERT